MRNSGDLEKIKIRSEKVRRILSEELPWIVRYGTIIISSILVIIVILIYWLEGFYSI